VYRCAYDAICSVSGYAIAGLVIFAGLTAFDFQRRRAEDVHTAPLLAASIFLDVLNVFLRFVSLFTGGE
jgi:FtsH-binding integral membrane protein